MKRLSKREGLLYKHVALGGHKAFDRNMGLSLSEEMGKMSVVRLEMSKVADKMTQRREAKNEKLAQKQAKTLKNRVLGERE